MPFIKSDTNMMKPATKLNNSFIAGNASLEKKHYDIFNRLIKTIDALNYE